MLYNQVLFSMRLIPIAFLALFFVANVFASSTDSLYQYIDPSIGSEGLGRVFIGPSSPFGMVKPSPDCTWHNNSGWAPMPERIDGFSQTHVSGTGGGPKYGNILIMPFVGDLSSIEHTDLRKSETIKLGYYATEFANSGIMTEVTTSPKASMYRIHYPSSRGASLKVDAGFFLGESDVHDAREAQQFVGSEIEVCSDNAVRGYSRVRGGWNNGEAYTVYFYLETDKPIKQFATWNTDCLANKKALQQKGLAVNDIISNVHAQADNGKKTGALLNFDADQLQVRIGISFISCLKAKQNLHECINHWCFDRTLNELRASWESLLRRIELDPTSPLEQKRMFYTALYHTMIMPSDRTGENPKWTDPVPYYDDFYAIWDTYRSSSPLITLIDPARQRDIVNSLINIGKRDGYMPDARSGNSNGRTQGGSNAEIVLADAFVKGLDGIDYEEALVQMLHDAELAPGGNQEAEGRGGLSEYLRLGYVPYGIDRAGNRTVEYSYCDYAIYLVARGLAERSQEGSAKKLYFSQVADRYLRQSGYWKNLWRADYKHDGAQGFIMPRNAEGMWLDSLSYGDGSRSFLYTPLTFEGPWYKPWWGMFMYEASSWEYSLSIPHDVPGLIVACGGADAFESRLNTFFNKDYFNVNNEPSFLTPCFYHWINKPWLTSERVRIIVNKHYSDTPAGLPGNDDSGAMSSWFAFHTLGLYPNAGQDYYILHAPLVKGASLHLNDNKVLKIETKNFSEKNPYIKKVLIDGVDYPYSTISHKDLIKGGVLTFVMSSKPAQWASQMFKPVVKDDICAIVPDLSGVEYNNQLVVDSLFTNSLTFTFKLHGQTRRYTVSFSKENDGIIMNWTILRNLHWQKGSFFTTEKALFSASANSFLMPEDLKDVTLADNMTSYLFSSESLKSVKNTNMVVWNNLRYQLLNSSNNVLHLYASETDTHMWVLDNDELPIIVKMFNNPMEINWEVK